MIGPRVAVAQSEQARPDQVPNNAGGWVFGLDDLARAQRFLILGTTGGTYYVGETDLTKDNAAVIVALANDPSAGPKLVDLIVEVSLRGRAPKQNPTLFALAAAAASADPVTKHAALDAVTKVCRTGTHLFIFARYVEQFRGWGPSLTKAVARWYTEKPVDDLAYQAVKYRQREGWTHRDLLRLSHPKTTDPARRTVFDWICGRPSPHNPAIIEAFETAQRANAATAVADLIGRYGLPWEALPDAMLNEPAVWEAMLPTVGLTALVRQLGRLTKLGVVAPFSHATRSVVNRLADPEAIRQARLHPLSILTALVTYRQGHGIRGGQTWDPVPQVLSALDDAFYMSFGTIAPAAKRTLVALDVSGSMTLGQIAGSPLTPLEAEAAMAMTVVNTEADYYTMAFSADFQPLALTPGQRLDDVTATMSGLRFGATDCAVPMLWATERKVPVDTFVIYTDNETWCGGVHPYQALARYRDTMGIPARLAVVGMTSTGFTIADPDDGGMLDLVGFDTATPEVLNAFSRGDV